VQQSPTYRAIVTLDELYGMSWQHKGGMGWDGRCPGDMYPTSPLALALGNILRFHHGLYNSYLSTRINQSVMYARK
jgi:hypothetical protein